MQLLFCNNLLIRNVYSDGCTCRLLDKYCTEEKSGAIIIVFFPLSIVCKNKEADLHVKTAVSSYQRDPSGLFEVLLNLKCFPV